MMQIAKGNHPVRANWREPWWSLAGRRGVRLRWMDFYRRHRNVSRTCRFGITAALLRIRQAGSRRAIGHQIATVGVGRCARRLLVVGWMLIGLRAVHRGALQSLHLFSLRGEIASLVGAPRDRHVVEDVGRRADAVVGASLWAQIWWRVRARTGIGAEIHEVIEPPPLGVNSQWVPKVPSWTMPAPQQLRCRAQM